MTSRVATILVLLSVCQGIFALAAPLAEGVCVVNPNGRVWCLRPDAVTLTCSFHGSWPLPYGLVMKSAISSAVGTANSSLSARGIPVQLTIVGDNSTANIQFSWSSLDCDGSSLTRPSVACIPGARGRMAPDTTIPVRFNPNYFNTHHGKENIAALHEILHALGMTDEHDTACQGSIMWNNLDTGTSGFGIDNPTYEALECLYGNVNVPPCESIWRSYTDWFPIFGRRLKVFKGTCNGCPCSESLDRQESMTGARGAIEYELAISSNDGPFETFAALDESDWIDDEYEHTFTEDHPEAILRLRVLDGMELLDEAFSKEPLDIVGEPGACCLPDGSCLVVPDWTECSDDGQFLMGELCSPSPCPTATGACCLPSGECFQRTVDGCIDEPDAVYQGNGTDCVPLPCDVGACCLADGSCVLVFDWYCLEDHVDGVFLDGPCEPNPCPQPEGACCGLFGECWLEEEALCPGEWQGAWTDCDPDPCPPSGLPEELRNLDRVVLSAPSPNPSSGDLRFALGLPSTARVTIDVFDSTGRLVESPFAGELGAGVHWFDWSGEDVPSGMFYLRATAGATRIIRHFVLMR